MKRIISFILSVLLVVNTTTFIYANDDVPTVEESTYTFSIEEVEGGTVSFVEDENNLYIPDTELYFNVEPDDGYILEDIYAVSKDNEDIKYELTLVEGKYLLVMPNDNVSIIPVFTKEVKEEIIEEEIEEAPVTEESIGEENLVEEKEIVDVTLPSDAAVIPELNEAPYSEELNNNAGYIQDNIPALSIYDSNYESEYKGAGGAAIPSKYSSVDKGYITPVKNQDPFGTCWAYAVISAAEASLVASGKETVSNADLSEKHLAYFSYHAANDQFGNLNGSYSEGGVPGFGSRDDAGDDNYLFSGGNAFTASQTLAAWKGPTYENSISGLRGTNSEVFLKEYLLATTAPNSIDDRDNMNSFYNRTAIDSKNAFSKDAYHLRNYYDISMKDVNDVKKAIMKYGGGSIALNINQETLNKQRLYFFGKMDNYYNPIDKDSNHLVAIVGWDDNYNKNYFHCYEDVVFDPEKGFVSYSDTQPKNNGAWLIKNSWGNNHFLGDGYFWISYEDLCLHQSWSKAWFYDFDSANNYDNNYQYDGSGAYASNTINSGGSIANVFTADGNPYVGEKLEAVSFTIASSVNVDYSIQVYTNLLDKNNPTSGTKAMSYPTEGKTKYPGYYTVTLNEPVNLLAGETFSVVITMSHNDGTDILYDVDRKDLSEEYGKFYHNAKPYRSFEKDYANSSWDDLSSDSYDKGDNPKCTARIKAFTSNNRTSIKNVAVSGISNKTYTGKAITQKPTVKFNGVPLVDGKDYTLTYKNNTNVGTATITITGKGIFTDAVSKTFNINANTKIKLNKTSATIGTKKVGKYTNTLQLKATVTGHNNTKVTWTSSNTKIAKVDKNTGKVTAVSDPKHTVSTVTITATTVDGKKATCKVTVEDPINAFVRRLYKYCLNRNPDKVGFDYWTSRLRSKKITAAEAVKGFFDSKEMKDMKLSNAETIERCYLVMMDRKSDKGGKDYWIKNYAKYGKVYVLRGFVDSKEFTQICKDFNITRGTIK